LTEKYSHDKVDTMKRQVVLLLALAVFAVGCGSKQTPRSVTFDFIGAVLDNDSLAVETYLDLDAMVAKRITEVPELDSTVTPENLRQTLIKNLTGSGGMRAFWRNQRIIVNQEKIKGDSAEVEMSFIDQTTGETKYSMVYLYRKDGRWRVYFYL